MYPMILNGHRAWGGPYPVLAHEGTRLPAVPASHCQTVQQPLGYDACLPLTPENIACLAIRGK